MWLEVLCWIDHVWSSKESVCFISEVISSFNSLRGGSQMFVLLVLFLCVVLHNMWSGKCLQLLCILPFGILCISVIRIGARFIFFNPLISSFLSSISDIPRVPSLIKEKCVISSNCALLYMTYDHKIRVQTITIYYKEALYKGMSEKPWEHVVCESVNKGVAWHRLDALLSGCSYRMYVVASNSFGDSPASKELRFRTFSEELEMRFT